MKVAIWRWLHCSHESKRQGWQPYSGRVYHLNNAQLGLKDYSVPHYYTTISSLKQCMLDPCIHDDFSKFSPFYLNAAEIETHSVFL